MPIPLDTLRSELDLPLAHPDAAELQRMGQESLQWLIQHFATLPEQSIGQTGSRHELEAMLREPLPELGRAFIEVIREFSEKVAPYSFRVNHPRFFAFIPSAPNYVSVLAELLCAGTNFFAGVWLEAAGPTQVELVVLDWFKELLGYPPEAGGILTGGGSEANLTALVVAREPLALEQRARSVIYLTEQRHWSIDRAARIMGLRAAGCNRRPCMRLYRGIARTVSIPGRWWPMRARPTPAPLIRWTRSPTSAAQSDSGCMWTPLMVGPLC